MNPDMAAALDPQQTDSEQPNNPLNIPTLFCLANLGHKISHRESLYFARSRLASLNHHQFQIFPCQPLHKILHQLEHIKQPVFSFLQ